MKKIKQIIQNLLKNKDFFYSVFCLAVLLVILAVQFLSGKSAQKQIQLGDLIELDMLTSVVLAFFLSSMAAAISRAFVGRFEDVTKLTNNYNKLVEMYEANTEMLLCRNVVDAYKKARKKTACKRSRTDLPGDTYKIPVGDVILLRGRKVLIHDNPAEKYTPPKFCREHYTDLLNAHDSSRTYNQSTLRVQNVSVKNGEVCLFFSRSTYFDALVSNRAIDYKINGLSVRDLYAHGPFLTPLKDSLLSNHMGFNGMVETSDGKFVFVKRHKQVSIGKNTMQCSIAAFLKAKYALNKDGILTQEGIAQAIIQEIQDELALSKIPGYEQNKADIFGDFSFENNVLYFYRDLLEGGKPQLMFYAKLGVPFDAIKRAYQSKNRSKLLKDGNEIKGVDINELKRLYLAPDTIGFKNRCYAAMPSAVATVAMLRQAMLHGLLREDVQESFTLSKKGDQISNEDAVYIGDRLIAVVDGVTSKTAQPQKATMSGGRFAAQTICDLLAVMPNETNPEKMLKWLNDQLKQAIANSVFAQSTESPMASLILYDTLTKTVISYGDCQLLLHGEIHKREKSADICLAKKRATILRAALEKGVTVESLLQNDVGRAQIRDELLAYASRYANKPGDGFPVLGRGEIVPEYIVEYHTTIGDTVILASDGYPVPEETLAQSEAKLKQIIKQDPLLIGQYQATKGVAAGNVSYDDRSYIRFTVG